MRESQRRALFQVRFDFLFVQLRLEFIGRQHHYHVGAGHRFRDCFDRQTGGLRFGNRCRTGTQTNHNIDTGIFQVVCVGMALRTVTNDRYFFAFDD